MSVPISAMIISAVRCCTPGIVQSSSTAGSKGRICSSIASESRSICSSRKSRWARIAADQQRVQRHRSGPPAPPGAPGSSCAACPARARPAPRGRSCRRPSASSIARPGLAEDVGGDAVELDPGVLEHLVQPVGLALALRDLRLAVAGQVPQRPDRLGRHEARPQQARLGQLAQPRGVGHVGLAARDLLDMTRVDQHAARTRPRGSPRPASSRHRSPPSRPGSRRAPASQSRSASSPRDRRRELRDLLLAPTAVPGTRTHAVTCALWTSSARGARRSYPS